LIFRTDRDQFTFEIAGGACIPLIVQNMTRCRASSGNTQMPSFNPTPAPTAPTISRRLEDSGTTSGTIVGITGAEEDEVELDALFW
jgi:hypothetical protein